MAVITLNAIQNAWVNEHAPNDNYYPFTYLSVIGVVSGGYRNYTFLKFDLSSIQGKKINSVKLKLYKTSGTNTYIHYVYTLNQTFSETTISWNTRPSFYLSLGSLNPTLGWNEWVLNLQNFNTLLTNNTGLGIYCEERNDATSNRFDVRSGTYPPQLIVDYTVGQIMQVWGVFGL